MITDTPTEDLALRLLLARGVGRALAQRGFATLTEVSLANGRRADVMGLGRAGELVIVEVKSSLQDFRSDAKWPEYREFCDRFYFAVAEGFPRGEIPGDCGLIVADGFGGAVLREAPLLT
ncbi:MAG TPA: MmcB family DNA repair protein, partial [Stellaceae bacterium]|nr:MmcB family DNA repair protein [Stellaceae bacterium]